MLVGAPRILPFILTSLMGQQHNAQHEWSEIHTVPTAGQGALLRLNRLLKTLLLPLLSLETTLFSLHAAERERSGVSIFRKFTIIKCCD